VFEPLTERADEARRLFSYAGAWCPPPSKGEVAWGALAGPDAEQGLIGALLLERKGATGMLYGPVVVLTAGASSLLGPDVPRFLRSPSTSSDFRVFGSELAGFRVRASGLLGVEPRTLNLELCTVIHPNCP